MFFLDPLISPLYHLKQTENQTKTRSWHTPGLNALILLRF